MLSDYYRKVEEEECNDKHWRYALYSLRLQSLRPPGFSQILASPLLPDWSVAHQGAAVRVLPNGQAAIVYYPPIIRQLG